MEIPGYSQFRRAYKNFSPFELVIFAVLIVLIFVSGMGLLSRLQEKSSTTVPIRGGQYSEGIVGFPQHINPVLARSNADQDVTALVHAGLTRLAGDGSIQLDLAESMEVSNNGEIYTFSIRDDAFFHDGTPVTADDVVFTISLIQDPAVNSPQQSDWNSIQVEALDSKTAEFRLSQPFTSFPFTTRIGILPSHLWQNESPESLPFAGLNVRPIGAGPYKVSSINRNAEGIPDRYNLQAAVTYPYSSYIENINLSFYATAQAAQEAFVSGDVSALYGSNPSDVADLKTDKNKVITRPLNRVFAVHYNQNSNDALVDVTVRKAIDSVIDRKRIVNDALYGYGSSLTGPLPPVYGGDTVESVSSSTITAANEALAAAGWEFQDGQRINDNGEVLSISLVTANIPELDQTADIIAKNWENIGVSVTITALPVRELTNSSIRPRDYEALLFAQVVNQSRDLYPFWHSSGQDDPGLNLSMYTNTQIDDSLSAWRTATSSSQRDEIQDTIIETIVKDLPASFIYSPDFIYFLPEEIRNATVPPITVPADRFAQIDTWHIDTQKLWNIFIQRDDISNQGASR